MSILSKDRHLTLSFIAMPTPVGIAYYLLILMLTMTMLTQTGCANKKKTTSKAHKISGPMKNSLRIDDLTAQVYKDGIIQQEVSAVWGFLDEENNLLDANRVRVTFYSDGRLAGNANCEQARYWLENGKRKKGDAQLNGNVVYSNPQGWILQTPELFYIKEEAFIYTDKGYTERMPDENGAYYEGKGNQFEAYFAKDKTEFKKYKKSGDVSMTKIKPPKPSQQSSQ